MDMKGYSGFWTKRRNEPFVAAQHTRRQHQCMQASPVAPEQRAAQNYSLKLAASISQNALPVFPTIVTLLLLVTSISPVLSMHIVPDSGHRSPANQSFRSEAELVKLREIRAYLKRINKPAVKTIKSPDGDLIDCVLSHQQPAFDHPELKGQKPLEPPEWPKGYTNEESVTESFQLWTDSGESCPEGTVPIRRTTEEDILRASSVQRFGRKPTNELIDGRGGNEHTVVYVSGGQYYGAKAGINVWRPLVTEKEEFSLAQIWVIAGKFDSDLNTIEAGWQVSPQMYGDNNPRLFTFWTADNYKKTGCYNLRCPGFIQTNRRIAIGAAISPISVYNGKQFDITLFIWKDPKYGNWWLAFGSGQLVGYWPASLFTHLKGNADMVQFGGEIVNNRFGGQHTRTQMGSGHFAEEGFGKAAYFRNLQVVDSANKLLPVTDIQQIVENANCYDLRRGSDDKVWGTYFYYGGPGRNVRCP